MGLNNTEWLRERGKISETLASQVVELEKKRIEEEKNEEDLLKKLQTEAVQQG